MRNEGELGTSGGGPCPGGLQLLPPAELLWYPFGGWGIEQEWLMFKAFIAEAAAESCGLRV